MLKRASATRPLLASAPTALRFGASSTSSSGALVGGAAKWKVLSSSASMQRRSIHKLPELSWLEQPSALNTCFSEETLTQHIKKHHLAHLQATNKLIEGPDLIHSAHFDFIRLIRLLGCSGRPSQLMRRPAL
jgi:hypothetical protein